MKQRALGFGMGACIAAGLLCLASGAEAATTWYVAPAPAGSDAYDGTSNWAQAFATISNAVAHAMAPDTILLTNGTHSVQEEVYVNKAVTVQGFGGRENTFVTRTGTQSNRIFRVNHAGAVLDGLTISNGYLFSAPGAGIYLQNGTVRNCTIKRNAADGDNSASGIGVRMDNGVLTNCIITENYRVGAGDIYGGGIYGSGKIQNCQIVSNSSGTAGGAYISGASTLMENCTILSNYCSAFSGGAYLVNGATIRNCVIRANRSNNHTGGMQVGDWGANNGYAYNCLVVQNYSATVGYGGMNFRGDATRVRNCTIVSNINGGVYMARAYEGQLQNCIVYYNSGGDLSGVAATTTYSCASSFLYSDLSNTTNPPKFVNLADGDYHLSKGSPCIDAGTTNVWSVYTKDFDGKPHVDYNGDGIAQPDMGCYEAPQPPQGTVFSIK